MNKENIEISIEESVTRDCPILFQMKHRPMTETTMCWGFECGGGWHSTIANACRELEMLNTLFYPKYRVRIQADQIKEKFGTLRFYYSIVRDPGPFVTWLASQFENIADYFNNYKKFNYEYRKVVDIEPFDYDDVTTITKEEFDRQSSNKYKCSNVEYKESSEESQKIYQKIVHLRNYGKSHNEPTKHILAWKLMNASRKVCWWLRSFESKSTPETRNCIGLLERKAEKITLDLEKECMKKCEDCGSQIGTDWSPSCQTTGWITFLCDRCADKSGHPYIKNSELWQDGKMIKTKEQLAEEYTKVEHRVE